jgi:hypothetical protein
MRRASGAGATFGATTGLAAGNIRRNGCESAAAAAEATERAARGTLLSNGAMRCGGRRAPPPRRPSPGALGASDAMSSWGAPAQADSCYCRRTDRRLTEIC